MIPVRLELRDFLSYAEPDVLDFTAFDVACLSGDNGVGKSALLDAMTWALFGRARGCESGQNQDRLIRDGCTEAVVDFTFGLGGATYRIVRRRTKTPRGDSKGDVRFLVADGDDVEEHRRREPRRRPTRRSRRRCAWTTRRSPRRRSSCRDGRRTSSRA